MLFNYSQFLWFFHSFFLLYWLVFRRNLKLQNIFIVGASYLFYGWWDYRFLSLIIASSLLDYFIGIKLSGATNKRKRKLLLIVSLAFNLGMLGFFKYCDFFIDSFVDLFALADITVHRTSLNIILPVGISFYTFQTLSYTIDVYRKKLSESRDLIQFLAYVSFFPQLVAGPIERATNLLPQFAKQRKLSTARLTDGLRQILWGLFKKVVIADGCARHVNYIFENADTTPGLLLILGAILFAFQIYCDFSGYSDIAIGTARLLGFDLMTNFRTPYFSRDIAEFWRRWHISLSSWFKDYVYIPLGGSRVSKGKMIRNTFIIFLVSGFWHGANWTFVIWGLINAIYFLPLFLRKRNRTHLDISDTTWPSLREIIGIACTFALTCIAWVFFRAESIADASIYFKNIFSNKLLPTFQDDIKDVTFNQPIMFLTICLFICFMLVIEWKTKNRKHGLDIDLWKPRSRIFVYYLTTFLIIFYGNFGKSVFIYFQF